MKLTIKIHLILALFVALSLTILPLPGLLVNFRPPWVLLFILYVQFYLPQQFSLIRTIILGLCLDILLSTLLGEHVLALISTTWIASSRVQRFHMFSQYQQIIFITLMCSIYQFILFLVDYYQGFNHTLLMVLGTTMISLITWPWVAICLNRLVTHPKSLPVGLKY